MHATVVGPAPIFLELRSTPTPWQKMELDPVQAPILATGASSDPVPLQLQIKQSSLLFCSLYLEKILLFYMCCYWQGLSLGEIPHFFSKFDQISSKKSCYRG